MKPLAKVQIISALKVCRNHVDFAKTCSQVKAIAHPPPPYPPTKPITPNLFSTPFSIAPTSIPNLIAFEGDIQQLPTTLSYFGNPCLDLLFRVVEPNTTRKKQDNRNYLDKLLPIAWSHNPLTTLKLICNLLEDSYPGKNDRTAFYEAVSWLHDNHPKTLACNLAPIATCFGFGEVLGILFRILAGAEMVELTEEKINELLRQGIEVHVDNMVPVIEYGLGRYENDSDYRFLHDRVTDLFADCLKSDIEQLNQLKSKLDKQCSQSDEDDIDNLECLEITAAGDYCPHVGSWFDCTTSLSVSIAKKIFPRISYKGFEEEEAEHAERAVEMLMKEVLVPLEDPLGTPTDSSDTNEKGYHFSQLSSWRELQGTNAIRRYLNTVKAGGKDKISVHDMFPHDIIAYAYDCDELREAAELQWKAVVEMYFKGGKFKKCLAVCDVSGSMMTVPVDVSVGLGLLVSELSEEPWNGKVITFNRNPQMVTVLGDDLRSKCEFVRKMDNRDWHCAVDFAKVFDLILEVAVKCNLKAEHMIKRVFVFTIYYNFDEISLNSWENDYEEIQRKYKEKGYMVPHLVVWNLSQEKSTPAVPCTQPGVTMLPGLNDNHLMNLFLKKGGDIGPDHVMEAALSAKAYQNLVVVD